MSRVTFSIGRDDLLSLVLVALALTNLSVAQFGDFRLTIFWPVFLLTMTTNTKSRGWTQLPRSTGAFPLAVVLMMLSWVINHAEIKMTTVALSVGWIIYWYWLTVVWGSRLVHDMERTLSWIAYIFFFTLLASGLLSFLGWSESPLPNLLGWVLDLRSGQPRFYGPTSEPSYAAVILGITGLGILRTRIGLGLPARSRSSDFVFVGILVSLLFVRSIYGIVVALLLLSAATSQATKRSSARVLFVLAFVPLILLLIELIPEDSRIARVFTLISQFNFHALQITDNSAYMRFGPTIEMISQLTPGQVEFWIGHGAGTAERFFGDLFGHLAGEDINAINLGFFPAFVFDYGVLISLAILVYLFLIARGPFSAHARFLVFIALLNCNFNTNLFWFLITVVFLTSPKMIGAHRRLIRQPNTVSTGTEM